jgi:hypothetical protein
MATLWEFNIMKKCIVVTIRAVQFAHKYNNQCYNYYILGLIDTSIVS